MKFQCPAKSLLAAVRRVMPAVMSAALAKNRPVMACVLIRAQDGAVTVSATNGEMWIRADVAEVADTEPGSAAVPADKLAAVLSELGAGGITAKLRLDDFQIVSPIGKFEFPTHEVNEFPDAPAPDDSGPWFDLSATALRFLIRRTTFACDKVDSARRFLTTGAVLERDRDSAVMVATDTKRIALAMAAVAGSSGEETAPNEKPPVIPAKVFQAVDRALDDDETVRVRIRNIWAEFRAPSWSLYTALMEGKFPPYRKIMNGVDPAHTLKLSPDAFLSSLRQAAVMTDSESMRVDVAIEPGAAKLAARSQKTGASAVTHQLPDYDGKPVSVAFDPAYLMEWFRAVADCGEVSMGITSASKPVTFRSGDSAHYLVMPLTS